MFVECRDNLLTKMVYKNPKFDLNKNPVVVCCNDEFDKDNQCDDTALRLECSGHGSISSASSRQQDVKAAPNGGCGLVLGLGATPSANERDLVLRLGFSHCSDASKGDLNTVCNDQSVSVEVSNGFGFGFGFGFDHVVDEGSTSAKSSGGYMPSLLLAPRISVPPRKVQAAEPEPSVVTGFLSETSSDQSGKKGVFAGSRVQETQENKNRFLGIRPQLFHGLVSRPGPNISPYNHSLSGSSGVSNSTSWLEKPAKRRQLIPPQVLVPSSMKSSSSVSPFTKQSSSGTSNTSGPRSFRLVAPEGRVHGGNLSPLVSGNLRDAVIDGI